MAKNESEYGSYIRVKRDTKTKFDLALVKTAAKLERPGLTQDDFVTLLLNKVGATL